MEKEKDSNSRLAEKLLSLRQTAGFTQEEISGFLGVSRQTVSKWETGKSLPDILLIKKLCQCYHISSDELLGLVDTDGNNGDGDLSDSNIEQFVLAKKNKLRKLHAFLLADFAIWIFLIFIDVQLYFWYFYGNFLLFIFFIAYHIVRFLWLHMTK